MEPKRTTRQLLPFVILLGSLLSLEARAGLTADYAKLYITPSGPAWLGGYQLRDAPSDGVCAGEELYVRAPVFDDGMRGFGAGHSACPD